MRLLQNPISKPNTRTSNIVEQPEIWPGWCTNGVRAQHLWQPFWCRAPPVENSRPRLASLGPADTVSPFVGRDFLELAVYCGDEGPEVLVAEGVGYKDAAWAVRSGRKSATLAVISTRSSELANSSTSSSLRPSRFFSVSRGLMLCPRSRRARPIALPER